MPNNTELKLREYIGKLQKLYSLSETIIRSNGKIEDVYPAFLDAVKKLLKAQKVAIAVFDANGLLKIESYSGLSKTYIKKVEHDKTWEPTEKMSFFPLIGPTKLLGKLAIYYKEPHKFTKEEMQFAQTICRQITTLLERRKTNISILNAFADGITIQDFSGKLIFANNAAVEASGYKSFEDMLKRPADWISRFELRDSKGTSFDLSKLPGRRILNGETYAEELIQFRNLETGERRWSIIKSQPILDEEGKLKMITNIIHDVTDRLELEKRKDEFISSASHELKTPLAVLKGFTQIMQGEEDYKKNKYYLSRVSEQIDRLSQIVNLLLDMSKIQAGKLEFKKEEFNILNLIKESVRDLQLVNNHKIILKNGISKRLVFADKYRVGEVLNNLVSNAVKFSPRADKIILDVKNKGNDIVVEVKDFGIGIPKKDLQNLFQPFFQVNHRIRQSFGGLGLGLHISSQIISYHGGKIWVKSRKGEGSTFAFSLPLSKH